MSLCRCCLQQSGIVRQWVGSFIVFMLVAMFFMSPIKIVFNKVVLPNLVLNRMEQGGLHLEGDHALLEPTEADGAAFDQSVLEESIQTVANLKKNMRTVV